MIDKVWKYTPIESELKPGDRFEVKWREDRVLIFVGAGPMCDLVCARPEDWDGDPAGAYLAAEAGALRARLGSRWTVLEPSTRRAGTIG